jgi:hypothetical protein
MPSRSSNALTDPTAPEQHGGERLAHARLRYPRRVMLGSPSHGLQSHVAAPSGQALDLRTARPVPWGCVLLLRLQAGQTVLARVTHLARQADGSWKIQCRITGAVEAPCAAESA